MSGRSGVERRAREPTWDAVAAFVERNPGGASLEEVGRALGVTRERIRQIEAQALCKLGLAVLAKLPSLVEAEAHDVLRARLLGRLRRERAYHGRASPGPATADSGEEASP